MICSILRQLDRRRFLGFPIWEFSLHSLPRLYGRFFLRHIVLRHPLRTLAGLLAYRRLSRRGALLPETSRLYAGDEAAWRRDEAAAGDRFLLGIGFCQKTLGLGDAGCPSGRFNHECAVLDRDDLLSVSAAALPLPCRECDVRILGTAGLRAGATVYLMTSAIDIAHHLFLPTLAKDRFRAGLFLQCPYSIPAMALPLLICRVRSTLVGYQEGDCREWDQFILADEGTKEEHTRLSRAAHDYVLDVLDGLAAARRARGAHPRRFRREGTLYVPESGLG